MKKQYKSPKIELVIIELEEGIATGSATATFTDKNGGTSPQVDPWTAEDLNSNPFPRHIENW